MKANVVYLKFILLIGLISTMVSCATTKEITPENPALSDYLSIEVECYHNAMPSTSEEGTRLPYFFIKLRSSDTLQENLKLIRLEATGENGTWETTTFDRSDFFGKGQLEYMNNARELTPSIGSTFTVKITVESDVNGVQTFEVKDVQMQTVY